MPVHVKKKSKKKREAGHERQNSENDNEGFKSKDLNKQLIVEADSF
jgi:hypothetical protein